MDSHRFPEPEIDGVYRAIRERRDMRHFVPGAIEQAQLARFIGAAHGAPSVGYIQPWRFVRITDPALRQALYLHVQEERVLAAEALGQRADEFMRLEAEGVRACGELLVVALTGQPEKHICGRRTMPHMDTDLASASRTIQNLCLAAKAEGIGAGWVSMFDPIQLASLCAMPEGSKAIALLCVGHIDTFHPSPVRDVEKWDQRRPTDTIVYENAWGNVPHAGPIR